MIRARAGDHTKSLGMAVFQAGGPRHELLFENRGSSMPAPHRLQGATEKVDKEKLKCGPDAGKKDFLTPAFHASYMRVGNDGYVL